MCFGYFACVMGAVPLDRVRSTGLRCIFVLVCWWVLQHSTGFARLVWGRLRVHRAFIYSDWFVSCVFEVHLSARQVSLFQRDLCIRSHRKHPSIHHTLSFRMFKTTAQYTMPLVSSRGRDKTRDYRHGVRCPINPHPTPAFFCTTTTTYVCTYKCTQIRIHIQMYTRVCVYVCTDYVCIRVYTYT